MARQHVVPIHVVASMYQVHCEDILSALLPWLVTAQHPERYVISKRISTDQGDTLLGKPDIFLPIHLRHMKNMISEVQYTQSCICLKIIC